MGGYRDDTTCRVVTRVSGTSSRWGNEHEATPSLAGLSFRYVSLRSSRPDRFGSHREGWEAHFEDGLIRSICKFVASP